MAPGRPVKAIKVKVARHNAQRVGAKLGAEIKNLARSKNLRTDINQPSPDVAQAVESASEWNSLLITARAERGPQWDVGTQQFLVDQYSELYYDPTPLQEAVKKQTEAENVEEQQQQQQQQQQQSQQASSRHHTPRSDRDFHTSNAHHQMGADQSPHHRHHAPPQVNYPYPSTPPSMRGAPPMSRPFQPSHPGAPFNPGPQSQFFPGDNPSPMRMGSMSGIGMVDHGHVMGGHPMGGMPGMGMGMGMGIGGGGMPAMPMNLSPEMSRRVTRGMADETGFPLH